MNFFKSLLNDFELNKHFGQRLFILILRGNRYNFKLLNFILKPIFKVLNIIILQFLFNSDIPREVKIGNKIRIPYPYNIIIKKNCEIGNYVTIFHGVTIGSNEKEKIDTIVGNNVYFGCNSTFIGISRIGNNVKVGSRAIVLKNIKKNQTITGLYK